MDADDVDPQSLTDALEFIRKINRRLRYNGTVIAAIGELTGPRPARAMSLLDVATGSGDLPVEVTSAYATVRAIGLDRHALTLAEAVRFCKTSDHVSLVRGDAFSLPFADASVDIVSCGLFLHHLSDEGAIAALAEMKRVARVGVVVADLLRSRRAYAWIWLFTLTASPMVRHDARASVAHAFTMAEARTLADRAGMSNALLSRTFGHRFLLTWRR